MKSKKYFFAVILALVAFACVGCSGLFTPGTTDVTVTVSRSLVADRAAASSIGKIELFMYNADSNKQIGSATVDVADGAKSASATFTDIELNQKAYVTAQFYLTTGKAYGGLITSSTETIGTNTAFTMTVQVPSTMLYVDTTVASTGSGTQASPYKTLGEAVEKSMTLLMENISGSYVINVAGDIDLSAAASDNTASVSSYALALDFSDVTVTYTLLINGGWQPSATAYAATTLISGKSDYVISVNPGASGAVTLKNIRTASLYYSGTGTLTLDGTTGINTITLAENAVVTLGSEFALYQQTNDNGTFSSPIYLATAAENGWSEGVTVVNCGTLSAAAVLSDFTLTSTGSDANYLVASSDDKKIDTKAYIVAATDGITLAQPSANIQFVLTGTTDSSTGAVTYVLTVKTSTDGTTYSDYTLSSSEYTTVSIFSGSEVVQTNTVDGNGTSSGGASITCPVSYPSTMNKIYLEAKINGFIYTATVVRSSVALN